MKKSFIALICLIGIVLISVQAQAWEWSANNLKLSSVSVSPSGIEFAVKAKGAVAAGCAENLFYVPNTHAEFNLMAASILMASASKKKIALYFDEKAATCPVQIDSIVMY